MQDILGATQDYSVQSLTSVDSRLVKSRDTVQKPAILWLLVIQIGMSFPVIMAHARAFVPPHLAGRGVTLMNLFGIGGVGLFQVFTSRVYRAYDGPDVAAHVPYQAVFALFAISMAVGLAFYLFAQDRTD